jgi:hypothetical protein
MVGRGDGWWGEGGEQERGQEGKGGWEQGQEGKGEQEQWGKDGQGGLV